MGPLPRADILAIGSCVLDISCNYKAPESSQDTKPTEASSNPAEISYCVGGTAHNMALAARYAGGSVLLSTVVADDQFGNVLCNEIRKTGLSDAAIARLPSNEGRTGVYVGNYASDKALVFGMADVSLMKHPMFRDDQYWRSLFDEVLPKWVLVDTTFSADVLAMIVRHARMRKAKIFMEPVSVPRARGLMQPHPEFIHKTAMYPKHALDVVAPNTVELTALYEGAKDNGIFDSAEHKSWMQSQFGDNIDSALSATGIPSRFWEIISQSVSLLPYIPTVITTLDEDGCLLSMIVPPDRAEIIIGQGLGAYVLPPKFSAETRILVRHFPVPSTVSQDDIVSVNGAGDSFNGALIAKCLGTSEENTDALGFEGDTLIMYAQKAAAHTVRYAGAVSPDIKSLFS